MIKFNEYLFEEKANKDDFGDLKADPKGKLHELLVGYHLRGGKHMDKHADIEGRSPKEVHDEIAEKLGGVNSLHYKNFSSRAKKAADDIKKQLGINDISKVQWTSKSGDIKRATGIDSTQAQDPSDIVVTDKNGKHHGVSLKVSDDKKPITLSNGGTEVTYGGDVIHENNRDSIKEAYPELKSIKNPDARKEWLRNNPEAKKVINGKNIKVLQEVAKNMSSKLNEMTSQQRAEHVRRLVLKAFSTPMEAQGHVHIRHFTGGGFDPSITTSYPGKDHEHILNDHENIKAVAQGTSVYFHHKGIPFAMQTAKMNSQSDPLSSLVVVGKDVKRKKDKMASDTTPVAPVSNAAPKIKTTKKRTVNPEPQEDPRIAAMSTDGGPEPRTFNASSQHGGANWYGPGEQSIIKGKA